MMIMDSSKPLYLQVEADIKNRILSKQYMPGDKLPTENELSDQYNVSKITIRKAIQNLSDEGYVNKVQGKGTFINFKKDKLYLNKTSGFKESLSSLGHASRFVLQQYYGILLFSENGSEYYGKQAADFGKALCGAGKKNPGLCKSEQAGCQRCYSYALQ